MVINKLRHNGGGTFLSPKMVNTEDGSSRFGGQECPPPLCTAQFLSRRTPAAG